MGPGGVGQVDMGRGDVLLDAEPKGHVAQVHERGGRGTPAWWAWLWGPGRRRRWRRLVLRRLVAATCAVAAVVGVLAVARAPQQAETTPVVIATRAIAAGQVVDAGSVGLVRWPVALAPDGALGSLAEVVGRPASSSLSRGEPVTSGRVSASALLAGQPVGTVAVHVSLVDAVAVSMLDEGERVDLLGPGGPVARDLTVLRVDGAGRSGSESGGGLGGGLGGGSTAADGSGAGMVVAADETAAAALAAAPLDALGRPSLTVVLRSR